MRNNNSFSVKMLTQVGCLRELASNRRHVVLATNTPTTADHWATNYKYLNSLHVVLVT